MSKNTKAVKGENKKQTKQDNVHAPFPIAGIGASAGGLEAIRELLEHLPDDLGMAYVIIQHLSPSHASLLPEILQRHTKMKVRVVHEGIKVVPNELFVIPPANYMSIVDGHLALMPRVGSMQGIHTIDYFLTTLAEVYKNNAIGIILSGTATDGTQGLQAIKAEGGVTFAQDATARFIGMPYNASASGFVDFVLSPAGIARELAAFVAHPYAVMPPEQPLQISETELRKIHIILNNRCGVDFSHYKSSTINRRILRRMALNRMEKLEEYTQRLRADTKETDLLYQDLLINVTSFFREPALYDNLTKRIFPALLDKRAPSEPVRIWFPACASGEEACTIAICLFEYLGEQAMSTPIQIFATDLSEIAIEKARLGIYSANALENVSNERLLRYFIKLDGKYQIIKPIRDVCIYATHNLIKDPPFSRIDLISCQNVMIYLEAQPQRKILQSFHYALKPAGFLMLGKSETIGSSTDLFSPLDKDNKIYTRNTSASNVHFDFTSHLPSMYVAKEVEEESAPAAKQVADIDVEKETDRLLLSRYVPASVVVNKGMQIIRFNGNTAPYLQPATGKASLHLLKMVRDELMFEIRGLINRAKKEELPVTKERVQMEVAGRFRDIRLEVVPVKSPANEQCFLIIFNEIATPAEPHIPVPDAEKADSRNRRVKQLEHELQQARANMKSMSEDYEATREELQSANEEVLSSNEELQSINEELETSKEELQSSNEELITINEELQLRNTDLKEASDYAEAIVQTIREPLVVLYTDMRVRTANIAFYKTFGLAQDHTEGNYLYEVHNHMFDLPDLRKQIEELTVKNVNFQNFEVEHTFPGLGRRILMFNAMQMNVDMNRRTRILLAIEDITERRHAETQLKENLESFRLLVQNAFDIISIFTAEGNVQYQSESIGRVLGYLPEEKVSLNIFDNKVVHSDDQEIMKEAFLESKKYPEKICRAEFRLLHKNGTYRVMEAVFTNFLDSPRIKGVVANYRDITERKMLERQKEEFIGIASHELKTPVTTIKAYTEILQETFAASGDTEASALVNKLDRQVERLTNLLKDLLDVTKIAEGQLKLSKSSFELDNLIMETVDDLQHLTAAHNIEVTLKPLPVIFGDRERIAQVLTNLLSNAIKYSPAGEKVVISGEPYQNGVRICVSDFGIGLPDNMQEKVFGRFFRAGDAKINTFPGLGLGLYIAAEIIERHGGRIWVESKPGEGASFYFWLPLF